jgi:predicted SnoaL-like aldol condensation-catalyzing enzyme
MMSDMIFDLDALMRPATEEEIAEFFPTRDRKSPQFEKYQLMVNAMEVGDKKVLDVPQNVPEPEEAARVLRYNFTEAGKARTAWKVAQLTDDETAQAAANRRIDTFTREDDTRVTKIKGEWRTEVKAPVIFRWKLDQTEVDREVELDGKKVVKKIKVPLRMVLTVVASEAVRTRARRTAPAPTEPTEGQTVEGEVQTELPHENGIAEPVPAAA